MKLMTKEMYNKSCIKQKLYKEIYYPPPLVVVVVVISYYLNKLHTKKHTLNDRI